MSRQPFGYPKRCAGSCTCPSQTCLIWSGASFSDRTFTTRKRRAGSLGRPLAGPWFSLEPSSEIPLRGTMPALLRDCQANIGAASHSAGAFVHGLVLPLAKIVLTSLAYEKAHWRAAVGSRLEFRGACG